VPTEPSAPQPDAPGPDEGTPEDAGQDTAQDTQRTTADWESRYREAQKVIAKQGQELGIYRKAPAAREDPEPEEEPDPEPVRGTSSSRLEKDSWRLAEQIYGEEAIAAYGRAATLLDRAATPADYVAAFEAYHQRRLEGAAPAKAAPAASAAEQTHTESNRPDAGPRTDFDQEAEAALAKGDSRGFLLAQIRKFRGE